MIETSCYLRCSIEGCKNVAEFIYGNLSFCAMHLHEVSVLVHNYEEVDEED